MRFQKTIAAFVATVGVSSSALGGNTDNFPRLGTLWDGGAQNYDSTYQTYAAKIHINVIGGGFAGWEASRGYSKESVISSIKAQSKINSRVFQFFSLDQANFVPAASGNPIWANKVISMNWWLYASGTSGTIVGAPYDPSNTGEVNMTSAAPRDGATGLGPYAWGAKLMNDMYHLGLYAGTSAAPSLDGFLIDNFFWRPRVDGDWLRTGQSTQSQYDATTQYNFRAGMKTYADELAAVFPSAKANGGNSSDWYPLNGANSVVPLGGGSVGIGFFESAIGVSNSIETWAGSAILQQTIQFDIANLGGPQYLIVSHDFVTATGADAYGPNWQAMRYGITATLMNNGYYFANMSSQAYDETARLWFDEYDGGGLGVGYLGQPLSSAAGAAQTAAWSNGVWKREFANGIALWNPKGNGAQTVSLSGLGNLKHFSGSQNPSLNNGATVTGGSVTLQDRDGIILMRLTAVKVPQAPSGLKLQN